MAKLRFSPKNELFEWEGTVEELLSIYEEIIERSIRYTNVRHTAHRINSTLSDLELVGKMPCSDDLVEYILSKPKYEHDIREIGEHFFHKQIKTREYQNLYRKLSYELEKARKRIEKEKQGAFEQTQGAYRNLKKYVFKPIKATAIENSSKMTS